MLGNDGQYHLLQRFIKISKLSLSDVPMICSPAASAGWALMNVECVARWWGARWEGRCKTRCNAPGQQALYACPAGSRSMCGVVILIRLISLSCLDQHSSSDTLLWRVRSTEYSVCPTQATPVEQGVHVNIAVQTMARSLISSLNSTAVPPRFSFIPLPLTRAFSGYLEGKRILIGQWKSVFRLNTKQTNNLALA